MSKEIQIEEPNGLMQDAFGRICLQFGEWYTDREHTAPDYVDSVVYVSGAWAHRQPRHEKYRNDEY